MTDLEDLSKRLLNVGPDELDYHILRLESDADYEAETDLHGNGNWRTLRLLTAYLRSLRGEEVSFEEAEHYYVEDDESEDD